VVRVDLTLASTSTLPQRICASAARIREDPPFVGVPGAVVMSWRCRRCGDVATRLGLAWRRRRPACAAVPPRSCSSASPVSFSSSFLLCYLFYLLLFSSSSSSSATGRLLPVEMLALTKCCCCYASVVLCFASPGAVLATALCWARHAAALLLLPCLL
jgi:hypothetical protein